MRKIPDLPNQKIKPSEDELSFADPEFSKWAENQDDLEVGKVVTLPSSAISRGGCPLSEVMDTSSNHHRFKHGSAFDGVRYTYQKEKNIK